VALLRRAPPTRDVNSALESMPAMSFRGLCC
jgi:hypothetical protein